MSGFSGRDENISPNGHRPRRRCRPVEKISGRRRPVLKAQSGRRRPVEKLSGQRQPVIFYHKNMLVRLAWTGPPAPARKLALAGTPAQPRFAPLQEKKISGTEFRRTPDEITDQALW